LKNDGILGWAEGFCKKVTRNVSKDEDGLGSVMSGEKAYLAYKFCLTDNLEFRSRICKRKPAGSRQIPRSL
jgi:hypothetical protein